MHAKFSGRVAAALTAGLLVLGAPSQAGPPAPEREDQSTSAADRSLQHWLHANLKKLRRAGGIEVVAELRTPAGTWRDAVGHPPGRPGAPTRDEAELRAASVNKMLTSVLALQLVESGRWTLDTTIGDVLPRLWPTRSAVTLRQLLSHTSGMPDHVDLVAASNPDFEDFVRVVSTAHRDRDLVKIAKAAPWQFEPGTDMAYSNTNYVVVGLMLTRATGQRMPKLLRQRVLRPARMTESRFATGRRLRHPHLHEYARYHGVRDLRTFHPSIFSAAGALVSTTRDLNRFHTALSRGRLLDGDLVREMRSVVTPGPDPGTGYGLGTFRLPDPCRPGKVLIGHDGATFGTLTMSFTTPNGAKRVTVAMTGRTLTAGGRDVPAMQKFVLEAIARTCAGPTPDVPTYRPDDQWATTPGSGFRRVGRRLAEGGRP